VRDASAEELATHRRSLLADRADPFRAAQAG
jgi:hypothetical protein